ncbi:MAG: FG-GAP-like repeat-containing protein [Bacteroidota bacterium]
MLPYDPFILKSSLGEDDYDVYNFKLGYGYNHQYARNNLQLNNGNNTFSEVGIFAGVYATDWSWATLLFDFDNDGKKDIFVSNGISKRMNDIDYVNFMAGSDASQRFKFNDAREKDLSVADKMPEIKLPNKFFLNQGEVQFEDLETAIKNNLPSYSNGAAYADFDRDGDLDVVVNNIEDGAYLYRNLAEENALGGDYLVLQLEGTENNRRAIGARALVFQGEELLQFENFPVRGFQSSVTTDLHLGLGDASQVDSILLLWPDQSYQRITPDSFNQRVDVAWQAGLPAFDFTSFSQLKSAAINFTEHSEALGLNHQHRENDFIEFNRERLLPNMNSTTGPALAIGDANGDQLEDVFVGASKWQRAALYLQQTDGTFRLTYPEAFIQDSVYEDTDALWLDFDNDDDQDLLVVSGGNEFWGTAFQLQPRLYLNDGNGQLQRSGNAFDSLYVNASCIAANDFNGDGAVDFFLGGATVPWNYGEAPSSYLLINDGQARFRDRTAELAPELKNSGMVKDAFWGDLDQDGDQDLVLSYEWGPIRIFDNQEGQFNGKALAGTEGWWNNLEAADIDGDGDLDFVAGNLGLNSKLKASAEQPVQLYIADFDENGKKEPLLTSYVGGKEVIFHNYKEVTMQMPPLKKRFLYAKEFAKASPAELVGKEKMRAARKLEAQCFENSLFINEGDLNFTRKALPSDLQYSPVKASLLYDFDQDGQLDLMLGSNFYENNTELGRYDASYGAVLSFAPKTAEVKSISPLNIKGQIRQIRKVVVQGQDYFLIARNNEQMLVLKREELIQ